MLKIKNSYGIQKSSNLTLALTILLCLFFTGCTILNTNKSKYDRGTVKVYKERTPKAKTQAKTKKKAQTKPKLKAQAETKKKAQTKPKPKAQAEVKKKAQTKPKLKAQAKVNKKPQAKPKLKIQAKPKKGELYKLSSDQLNSVYVKGGVELGSKNNKKEEDRVLEFVQKNEKQHTDTPSLHLKPTSIKPDQGIKIPTNLDSNVKGEVQVEASLID